ncbi:hypothetical protein PENANT_c035G07808 [Penicillium antarcticum]|uniref:Uncharacterized protein n=1 Tax=Penicillium antarcticum TaxID=416450 RepID=A0A1V6PUW2_9EURO|nr:hypothetical protein PENANT_c035G07808 [Penicillium antarcticum]
MHLSANVSVFLLCASQAGCSQQQHMYSTAKQGRCAAAFRATATRIFHAQGILPGIDNLPREKFNLGWADAVMVYGSLRTIATSPMSLGWQKDAANRVSVMIKERLGFQLSL